MKNQDPAEKSLIGRKSVRRRAEAFILAFALAAGLLAGCGETLSSSGEEEASASESADVEEAKDRESAAEEAASVIAPDKDITQTVTVKAAADGTPKEVRVKDSREEIEEKADPEALPFAVHIRYFLDGAEKTPEEIEGKSGHVTIRFEYENRTKRTASADGVSVVTKVPFVFISAVILSDKYFSNIEVENGEVSSFKNNTIAFGYALPGWEEALALKTLTDKLDSFEVEDMEMEDISADKDKKQDPPDSGAGSPKDSGEAEEEKKQEGEKEAGKKEIDLPEYVEISADTTGFQVDFTATVVMNGMMKDSDLTPVKDVKELTDEIGKFTDAGDKLEEGTEKLSDGAGEFRDYLKQYTDGVSGLSSGASKLSKALTEVYNGIRDAGLDLPGTEDRSAVAKALQSIAADGKTVADQLGGLENLKNAAQSMSPAEMQAAAETAAAQVAQAAADGAGAAVYESLKDTDLTEEQKTAAAQAAGASASAAASQAAKEAVAQLLAANGIDLSAVDMKVLSAAAEDIRKQMTVLSGFAETLQGDSDLNKQIEEAEKQLKSLKEGMAQLQSGSEGLAEGISQIASAGGKLVEGYDALQDGIGRFRDGIREFNEKGIQKLGELTGEELLDTARRVEAMQQADRSYRHFDGTVKEDGTPKAIAESEEGEDRPEQSVRFIIETEEIG